jgi:hypothetical protein
LVSARFKTTWQGVIKRLDDQAFPKPLDHQK